MAVIATGQEVELRRRLHLLGYELRRSPVRDPKHPATLDSISLWRDMNHSAFSLNLDGVAAVAVALSSPRDEDAVLQHSLIGSRFSNEES